MRWGCRCSQPIVAPVTVDGRGLHCSCDAYERVVTAESALPIRYAQLKRDHEGDGHEVRFDEHDWQPGGPS